MQHYKYGVFGNPILHSLSPFIHYEFAKQTGQKITYETKLVPLNGFLHALVQFQKEGGCGLNITLPFKEEAYRLAASLSVRARTARAVNILSLQDGNWAGDNTDGMGLIRDLVGNYKILLQGRRILILGAGGAARGIIGSLLDEKPLEIIIANRTSEKAKQLANYFQDFNKACLMREMEMDKLADLKVNIDGIINATSASIQNVIPPIFPALCEGKWCYDLAYSTEETIFQKWAASHGASESLNGLGMLVEQAAESFLIWRGIKPKTIPVIEKLRREKVV